MELTPAGNNTVMVNDAWSAAVRSHGKLYRQNRMPDSRIISPNAMMITGR